MSKNVFDSNCGAKVSSWFFRAMSGGLFASAIELQPICHPSAAFGRGVDLGGVSDPVNATSQQTLGWFMLQP